LHVVLEHHKRLHQRDPLLWNVACDYVINNWLEQMGVGMRPQGTLYKESYKGRDAESIYDELIQNGGNEQLKLVSFRGEGVGDMLDFDPNFRADSRPPTSIFRRNGVRQMAQNAAKKMLEDQSNGIGRGTLPGDLIEELGLKPDLGEQVQAPEWKADLAEWFNVQFLPKPPRRSYNRMSRRQSAVPNIPLPGRAMIDFESPTFGVVLDTSGSMSHELLQLGLAAVVAFSGRHGVTHLRLVMCDTRPYDEGFIPLPTLKKPYQIRGRGGTILQPAITLLEAAKDFPDNAPILIVTDGAIDILEVEREHAYLLPGNGSLPFEPKGPVFTILGETRSSPFRRRFTTPAQK
jgi:predicted metal-dependent peptidase